VDALVPYVEIVDEPWLVQIGSVLVTCLAYLPFLIEAHVNLQRYGRATLLFWSVARPVTGVADVRRRAAYKRDYQACRMLVNAGADAHWRNPKTGETPLDVATRQRCGSKLVELLTPRAAPLATPANNGTVLPAIAVSHGERLPAHLLPTAARGDDGPEIVLGPATAENE